MKIYIATYKADGHSLKRKWLNLEDYENRTQYQHACRKLVTNQKFPQVMPQNIEFDYGWEKSLFSSFGFSSKYWKIRSALKRLNVSNSVFSEYVSKSSKLVSEALVLECAMCS